MIMNWKMRTRVVSLLLGLAALGASVIEAPVAMATEYYVSPTGVNSNPGTEALPFGSIQWAANISTPGDTTFVRGGTYSETFHAGASIVIRNDGTANDWINFRAYPGETPVIDHSTYAGFLVLGNYVGIDGFEVTTTTGINNPGQPEDGLNWGSGISVPGDYQFAGPLFENKRPHHVKITNNHIYGMGGSGVTATKSDYLHIEGNVVHDNSFFNPNQSSGISLFQLVDHDTASGYHNIIRGNTSYSNENTVAPSGGGNRTDGNGIIIDDGRNEQFNSTYPAYTGSTLIENNVLFDNGGKGVNVFKSDNVDVVNNTLYKNGKDSDVGPYQISHGDASNVGVYNNVFYGRSPSERINFAFFESNINYDNNLFYNGTLNTASGVSYGSQNIYDQDPLLVNPTLDFATANFRQTTGSPTINAGHATIHAAFDRDGVARPIGSGYDIGAYEVAGSNTGPVISPINFEQPGYSTTGGHSSDGELAGQGGGGDPGCPDSGNQVGCWDNVYNPTGLKVTAGAGSDGDQGLVSSGSDFAPYVYHTDDALLGGTFDSASSILEYSFEYRMDSIGSGFSDAFQFGVTGASDHVEHVMKIGVQDHGGLYIEHGGTSDNNDGRTYLTRIGQPGSLLLDSPDFNVISGEIDYASQTFTVFINGAQYSYESGTVTDNGGNFIFDDTSALAIAAGNIMLLAANNSGVSDASYTIDDLLLRIAAGTSGDFDNDGDVDGSDFLAWQRNDGTASGLTAWQDNYGIGSAVAGVATVPEPSTLALLGSVLSLLLLKRHKE